MQKPFSSTAVGKFLSATAPDVLNTVGNILPSNGVFGIVKNIITQHPMMSDAQKEEALKLAEQDELDLMKEADENTKNARETNTQIQLSETSSWMAKNFAYFLDGAFCILFGIMLFMVYKRAVPIDNKELFYSGFGLLGGIVTTIINFHRGSSIGSKTASESLKRIAESK